MDIRIVIVFVGFISVCICETHNTIHHATIQNSDCLHAALIPGEPSMCPLNLRTDPPFISHATSPDTGPEQVHISYGDSSDVMVVMWSSRDERLYNLTYGTSLDRMYETTGSDVVKLPSWLTKAAPFVYRAELKNLTEGTQYFYRIVEYATDNVTLQLQSQNFSFTTQAKLQTKPMNYLVYGDMGISVDTPTYEVLERLVNSGNYTAIMHVGDFAYDLKSAKGLLGDLFFRKIQPFASRIPYMPTPGNHEIFDDFIDYRIRFSTPNTQWPIPIKQMWYSYNVGLVHFISYSTEVFFTYNQAYVCRQFDWLLQDLITANKNRDKQPWIVALGHRPMYCSNNNGDDCTNRFLRRWVRYGLEELFYAQGVDLIIQAHEHSYERLWPVYKGDVYGNNYVNPRAPVHIISGAAGNVEGIEYMSKGNKNAWSAFKADKTSQYTFGQLEIHNKTHLYFEQREAKEDKVLDGFWLVQKNHGPFIANVTCQGQYIHPSCACPPPILYIYYIVGAALGVVVLVTIVLIVFVIYRKKCRNSHTKSRKIRNKSDRVAKYTELHEEGETEKLNKIESDISAEQEQRCPNQKVPGGTTNEESIYKSHDSISINSEFMKDFDDVTQLLR